MLLESILPQHQRAYEEDTAVSIIRREGFPPTVTQHGHVPHAYGCPCCSGLSPRRRTARDGPSAEELDHRKRMQWDIFEDRALSTKPSVTSTGGHHRNVLRRFYATLQRPMQYTTKGLFNPPPPQTLTELRHGKLGLDVGSMGSSIPAFPGQTSLMRSDFGDVAHDASTPFLLLTIHQGRGFPSNNKTKHLGYQIQARYGTVEGMTQLARRCDVSNVASGIDCDASYESTSGLVQWDESFELPLQDLDTPIELFVIDTDAAMSTRDAQCGTYLLGGVMIAPPQPMESDADTWAQFRGDHEVLVATMFEQISPKDKRAGSAAPGGETLVSLCVSWEVVSATQLQSAKRRGRHTDPIPELFAPVPIALVDPQQEQQETDHVSDGDDGASTPEVTIVFDIDKVELYRRVESEGRLILPLYCMLRGPDGDCSDYVALRPQDPVLKPLRFDDADETGRTCTIRCPVPTSAAHDAFDNARMLQVLVCCNEVASQQVDDGAPLRVLASTALTFTALPSKGTATYVLECVQDDDQDDNTASPQRRAVQQPFGEISVHWTVDRLGEASEEDEEADATADVQRPLFDDRAVPSGHGGALDPKALDADVLSVVVVRGIDLRRPIYGKEAQQQRSSEKLARPLVSVAVGPLLASTPTATVRHHLPERGAPCNVVWNQELVFPLPEHAPWDRNHIEVILQEDYEIVSLGSIYIQEKLAAARGEGVVEGFDVVPLVQQGYNGALGHVLVRWKFVYHDVQASLARRKRLQPGQEGEETAPLEDAAGTPQQQLAAAVVQDNERAPTTPPLSHSPGESPRSSRLGPSPRKSVVTVPSPTEPSAASTTDHSPYGKRDSIHVPNSRTASLAMGSASSQGVVGSSEDLLATSGGAEDDGDLVFEVEADDDEASPPAARQVLPQATAASASPQRLSLCDDPTVSDDALVPSTTDAPSADAAPSRPTLPKLAFCVRTDAAGKPCVSFYDAAAAAGTSVAQDDDDMAPSDLAGTCTPPPVNGPCEWSSQLLSGSDAPEEAMAREKDARELLREELEVRYRGSRHPNRFLASPRGHWQQSQPWYPPGEGKDESHVPLPRRESERKQLDAIVELMLKSRAVAEQSNARQQRMHSDVSRSTSVSTATALRHTNL